MQICRCCAGRRKQQAEDAANGADGADLGAPQPVTLAFRGVRCVLAPKKKEAAAGAEPRTLLSGISGVAKPGRLLAVRARQRESCYTRLLHALLPDESVMGSLRQWPSLYGAVRMLGLRRCTCMGHMHAHTDGQNGVVAEIARCHRLWGKLVRSSSGSSPTPLAASGTVTAPHLCDHPPLAQSCLSR